MTNIMNLASQISQYLIIILMVIYTVQSYTVFRRTSVRAKEYVFLRQNICMFVIHFLCFAAMFMKTLKLELLVFYGAQFIYLAAVLVLFRNLYPKASKLLINNMCMLLSIGFIMVTRLSFDWAIKQFKIAVLGAVIALLIPVIIRKLQFITKMTWAYAFVGVGLLGLVVVAATVTNGAKLALNIGGFSFQPSEFVKIIFVFAVAGLLSESNNLKRIIIATGLAAVHVLILVISKDLGSALIFFITYLAMLFVATRNPFWVFAGLLSGSLAAVIAYFLFSHIRVRVSVWLHPFADYSGSGYQICQSLFAICAGGWFGTGLYKGSPTAIPYAAQDFMFSAISEEMGAVFSICLIFICMSCFIMFINISMKLTSKFYRLVALGLGTTYAVQVFLTIGGGMKLIPLTGVTLPLVSYGGSSVLSTLIMFAIVQGMYMLRRDEEDKDEEEKFKEYQQYQSERDPFGQGQTGDQYRP